MFCFIYSLSKASPLLWTSSASGPMQVIKTATPKGLDCETRLVTVLYAVQTCLHFDHFGQGTHMQFKPWTHGCNGAFQMKADGCASAMWAVL